MPNPEGKKTVKLSPSYLFFRTTDSFVCDNRKIKKPYPFVSQVLIFKNISPALSTMSWGTYEVGRNHFSGLLCRLTFTSFKIIALWWPFREINCFILNRLGSTLAISFNKKLPTFLHDFKMKKSWKTSSTAPQESLYTIAKYNIYILWQNHASVRALFCDKFHTSLHFTIRIMGVGMGCTQNNVELFKANNQSRCGWQKIKKTY